MISLQRFQHIQKASYNFLTYNRLTNSWSSIAKPGKPQDATLDFNGFLINFKHDGQIYISTWALDRVYMTIHSNTFDFPLCPSARITAGRRPVEGVVRVIVQDHVIVTFDVLTICAYPRRFDPGASALGRLPVFNVVGRWLEEKDAPE